MLKNGQVPIEKYLKFREEYIKRTEMLQSVISKENEYVTQNQKLANELLKSQENLNGYIKELTEARNFEFQLRDMKILNGHWNNTYQDIKNKSSIGREDLQIENGLYYLFNSVGERIPVFNITNFYFNNKTKEVFFIKERVGQVELLIPPNGLKYNYNSLKVESEDLMTGIENNLTKVTYRRKPETFILKEGLDDEKKT